MTLLHQLFEKSSQRFPNAKAIVTPDLQFTYKEVALRTNQVARKLLQHGSIPNTLIAVVMDKGWEQVIAVLGILKSGAAYLPIDPTESPQRLVELMKQGQVSLVLTQKKYKNKLPWLDNTFVFAIDDEQTWREIESKDVPCIQNIDDLAYVIFTSGSTGLPKGVMIDHKGAINTILDINRRFNVNAQDKILALSALTFDLSVYDIFGALAVGATIVIPYACDTKEPTHWLKLLLEEKVTIWNSAPAFMQMLVEFIESHKQLITNNKIFSFLRLILLSGDWIPISLPARIYSLFNKTEIISLGGATEASIWSILYPIKKIAPNWKSIPYGKPMENQEFHILNDSLNPVSPGSIGNLYIGGVGLAKGYWRDSKRTNEQFIIHPKTKQRLYKTGDLGRYLEDGNIEFLGRIDHQVKVRGYRIETNAIENCLSEHPWVNQSLVTTGKDRYGNNALIAYIVSTDVNTDTKNIEQLCEEQISHWQTVYNQIDKYALNNNDPSFNTAGWISSYNDQSIPAEQMKEWVNNTVKKILALNPQKVFEIGCGTGLLLFNIAPLTKKYLATDFSFAALSHIQNCLISKKLDNVFLKQRMANEFVKEDQRAYDTLVINSVVQYFPSIDYFVQILEGAIDAVSPGGHIFIGDVRSLIHLEAFHSSVELFKATPETTFTQWKSRVERAISQEEELLIDPKFFEAFAKSHPRISGINIELKKGIFHNEMNCFRYDVILYIEQTINQLTPSLELDWKKNNLTYIDIFQLLKKNHFTSLKVSNIPNGRLAGINKLVEPRLNAENFSLTFLRNEIHMEQKQAVDPDALWEIGDELSYETTISWAKENPQTCMDVTFYQHGQSKAQYVPHENLIDYKNPSPNAWSIFSNSPLKSKFLRKFPSVLKSYLQTKLPLYMVPSIFVFLDKLPITPNGKVDRKNLPLPDYEKNAPKYVAPSTNTEKKLVDILSGFLGVKAIGIHDNFLEFGGNSLLAVQIAARIRQFFFVDIDIQDILFNAPTVYALSNLIEAKSVITKANDYKQKNSQSFIYLT